MLNLRAIAGEYDWQERHIDIGKLPVFLENQQKGNYKVVLDPGRERREAAIHVNQSYEADPEIAKWLTQRRLPPRALARASTATSSTRRSGSASARRARSMPDEASPYSPGPEWRTKWSTLDVKQANELLDKIGLTKKDAEGFRLRTDGKGRLRLEVVTVAGGVRAVRRRSRRWSPSSGRRSASSSTSSSRSGRWYEKRAMATSIQIASWATTARTSCSRRRAGSCCRPRVLG